MFSLYSQLSLYLQSPPLAYIQSCTRLLLFGTFELAISMPVEVGKSYIHQKKALVPIVLPIETGRILAMEGSRLVLVEVDRKGAPSTKTRLEPSMAKICPVSKLLLNNV